MTRELTVRNRRVLVGLVLALVAAVAACSSTSTSPSPSTSTSTSGAPGTVPPTSSAATASTVKTRSDGCAGDPAAVTGQHVDATVRSSGADRTYKRYVPAMATAAKDVPAPLIIDLHGYSEGNGVHTAMSNLTVLADKKGFVLATPQGNGTIPYWNAVPNPEMPDDVQFVSDLIDDIGRTSCLDLSRVYVTGLSNGAFMTSLVACKLAGKVAAVAPVAGWRWPADCQPSRPVPTVAFHGTADQFVTYDGSTGAAVASLPMTEESSKAFENLTFTSIPETLTRWATEEGCSTSPTEEQVSASVKVIRYGSCRDASTVELYVVEGGGHAWPGSEFSRSIERVMGPTTFEIDANEIMWAFFERFRLPS